MNKAFLKDFGLPLALLLALTALIAASGADLGISSLAYRSGNWPLGDLQPWRWFYLYGFYPSYILAGASLLLLIASLYRPALKRFRRGAAFMVILMALGPGLLVNKVFKENWGRERPHEMALFGGTRPFQQPWEFGGTGRSFPSGHAASAFYLSMPYFVLRRRNRGLARTVYGAGMIYSLLMGIARIVQGGHFVSDILWAWGVVHLTAVVLYYLMEPDREENNTAPPAIMEQ